MQREKLNLTKNYTMNLSHKIANLIFNIEYWKEFKENRKMKDVLVTFFQSEDAPLQQAFISNFDYPEEMMEAPVRYEHSSGDIYYTINFKSKELFDNQATKEKATSNSLAALDKFLPLGVTQYLEPQPLIHIPDSFTYLCSLKLQTDVTTNRTIWNIVGSVCKPLIILTILGACVKYFFI